MTKIRIVTHNAKFHSDDVFGVAALFLLLGEENCEVFRTRDPKIVTEGDYVLDVGEESDPTKKRFDHHQEGGAGERSNGVPYASVGLIWKEYGATIAGSKEVAEKIDQTLIQTIDAGDNGKDISQPLIEDVMPYTVSSLVNLYRPTWKEDEDWDRRFLEAVRWAKGVLERTIKMTKDILESVSIIKAAYERAPDKRLIVLNETDTFGREAVGDVLMTYAEPLFAVLYRPDAKEWQVITIRKSKGSFAYRKALPEAWGAKHDEAFAEASGVADAAFCHRRLFMCTAHSKEGALKLAELALKANS